MEIVLKLQLSEVNTVLDALGALPTSTNVWPVAANIRAQAQTQLPAEGTSGNGSERSSTD
jgi:hypothetical protein